MRITRISRLRNCGIFRDFIWQDLPEFAKLNLIYGWNGSGKTTISRVMRSLELCNTPHGDIVISTESQDIHSADFSSATVPVRVFNKDFVNKNVFPIEKKDISPILVLGQDSIEKYQELEKTKLELENTKRSLKNTMDKKKTVEEDLDQHCVDRGRDIKMDLLGPGDNNYHKYDKRDYRLRAEKMLEDGDAEKYYLEDTERRALIVQHSATPKTKVEEITYQESDFTYIRDKVADLLSATVVSETIQSLRDDVEISEWVRQGLDLHRKHNSGDCIFCEQSLPERRLSALERHFNIAYEGLISSLNESMGEIGRDSKSLAALEVPDGSKIYEHLVEEYGKAKSELKSYCSQADAYLESLRTALSAKKKQPFDQVSLDSSDFPLPDNGALERLNNIIRRHNSMCESHAASAANARQRLEFALVAEGLTRFKALHYRANASRTSADEIAAQVDALCDKISKLASEIMEHRKPAEELNDDLYDYLGHRELQLEVRDNGYAITRQGDPMPQPSEGETTAIALLYFLKSLNDNRFDVENGVVVLDDPVSSLDANALFMAHAFVRGRTKHAGQLFILTHNFTYFREVRNWFCKNKGCKGANPNAQLYMLDCQSDGKGRHSKIQTLDPLLKHYESDYHYLFACVWRGASSTGTLEANYALPNLARRLLETFLAFRQPHISNNLSQKIRNVGFDEVKTHRILNFVHAHSHSHAIAEMGHDLSLLGEVRAVLSDLLRLIEKADKEHYDHMVDLVKQANSRKDE